MNDGGPELAERASELAERRCRSWPTNGHVRNDTKGQLAERDRELQAAFEEIGRLDALVREMESTRACAPAPKGPVVEGPVLTDRRSPTSSRRVALLPSEPLRPKMAGIGLRYFELAKRLPELGFDVVLLQPGEPSSVPTEAAAQIEVRAV